MRKGKAREIGIIAAWLCLLAVSAWAVTKYTVKSGDNVAGIAHKFGVSAAALAKANHLDDPDKLAVGQVLVIPAAVAAPGPAAGPAPATAQYPLPAGFKKQIDGIKVVAGKWRFIVVHHSATPNGDVAGMDAYHRKKKHMENGLAYHFVIGNGRGMPDGLIAIGNRWKRQIKGGHLASPALNEKSVGICLVGNFNKTRPTPKQMQSLNALVSYLLQRCRPGTHAVKLHKQINTRPTECPGRLFPTKALVKN